MDEILKRFGLDVEGVEKLNADAARAEQLCGIHGVSVTARDVKKPAVRAARAIVESVFPVYDTPSRNDPSHRTVVLPKPVTQEVADVFNDLFQRRSS